MDATRKKYIDGIQNAVLVATLGSQLFPSVMLAQAALESGNGQSYLAKKFNNHFGIKAGSTWKGKTASLPTKEFENGKEITIRAGFRAYDNLLDGFFDRVKFLKVNPRYTKAGVFSATTPEAQIRALQAAGYATDPQYAAKLLSIMNVYNLKTYDTIALKKKV